MATISILLNKSFKSNFLILLCSLNFSYYLQFQNYFLILYKSYIQTTNNFTVSKVQKTHTLIFFLFRFEKRSTSRNSIAIEYFSNAILKTQNFHKNELFFRPKMSPIKHIGIFPFSNLVIKKQQRSSLST